MSQVNSQLARNRMLAKWRKALSDHDPLGERGKNKGYWEEGPQAVECLRKAGLLPVVMQEKETATNAKNWRPDWRSREAIWLLLDELTTYRKYVGKLVSGNQYMADLAEFCDQVERRLIKQKRMSRSSEAELIAKYIRSLRRDRAEIEKQYHKTWQKPFGVFGEIFHEAEYKRHPFKAFELESRFQIRIAKILRFFLGKDEGVDLRTIGRMVALFYQCTALAEVKEGRLVVCATKKELTVDAIYQKLRRAMMK